MTKTRCRTFVSANGFINEYYHWYDAEEESKKLCGSFLIGFLDFLDTLNTSDIIAITEGDGIRRVYYRQTDREALKRAVAQVCLKPGDPCDPQGVFNE
jgi:hypothetical protein